MPKRKRNTTPMNAATEGNPRSVNDPPHDARPRGRTTGGDESTTEQTSARSTSKRKRTATKEKPRDLPPAEPQNIPTTSQQDDLTSTTSKAETSVDSMMTTNKEESTGIKSNDIEIEVDEQRKVDEARKREKEEKILKIFEELKNKSQGHREKVREIAMELDIECDLINEIDAKSICDRLRKETQTLISVSKRKNISCIEVLQKCSGGVCLKGFFYKGQENIASCICAEKTLLGLKKGVSFQNSFLPKGEINFEFEDVKKHSMYLKLVRSLGHSFAQGLCASLPSIGVNEHSQHQNETESDTTEKETTSIELYGTTTSVLVPVAHWEPHIEDMCLSENAKKELKDIEKCLMLDELERAEKITTDFFKRYGSHVCIGNIHFGGIQIFTTVLENKSSIEKNKIKEIVKSEHNAYLSGFMSKFGLAKVSGDISDEYIKQSGKVHGGESQEKHNITTSTISVIGGPDEVYTTSIWKQGLIEYNTTWAMIDRQYRADSDFVGIWNLVLSESDKFCNPEMLYHFLEKKWGTITGLPASDSERLIMWKENNFSMFLHEARRIYSERKNKDGFLKMIRSISENVTVLRKNGDIHFWMKHLREKNSVCKEIIQVTNEDVSLLDEYEFCSCFLNMFSCIPSTKFEDQKNIQNMLGVLYEKTKTMRFETKEMDIKMICQFISSETLLEEAREFAEKQKSNLDTSITKLLGMYAASWLKSMWKMPEHSQLILLISVFTFHDYNHTDGRFECLIPIEKLQQIGIDLSQSFDEYQRILSDIKSKQAYSILLLMSKLRRACDCEESFKRNFLKTWEELQPNLIMHHDILQIMVGIKNDFTRTETALKRIEEGVALQDVLKWKYFEDRDEQPVKSSNRKSREPQTNLTLELQTLLSRLHIYENYFNKIKISNVVQLEENVEENTLKTLPLKTLRQIISLDFSFRDSLLAELKPMERKINWFTMENEVETQFVDANDEFIHPTDLFCALYLCCDCSLRGLIVRKMALLQFAIPFTIPIHQQSFLYIWPLRSIYLDNRLMPVMEERFKYVAFVRYGALNSVSKSRVLNELLSPIKHDTFYHRDCELGKRRRKISNGLIEIAWHVSGDKCTGFLNLRGDARDFEKEANLSLSLSSVFVVFLHSECIESLENLLVNNERSRKMTLILITAFPKTMSLLEAKDCLNKLFEKTYRTKGNTKVISMRDFQSSEEMDTQTLVKNLRSELFDTLENLPSEGPLERKILELTDRNLFKIDEEDITGKTWKSYASTVYDYICKNQADKEGLCSSKITPLQGEDLWQRWSRISKEIHKEPQFESYDIEESKKKILQSIRRKQISFCNDNSQVTAKFVECLLKAEKENDLHYFLSWLEIFLHRHYRDHSTTIKEMDFAHRHVLRIPDQNVDLPNFGLGHLFREMGQIYEAFMFSSETMMSVISEKTLLTLRHMPVIMAKLLLSGKEVEVLDGFAGNVPLLWIKAIFREIVKLLPGKKVVSLSVVGIQSSGKSTMLNTMFGVEFHVSAGKCTRGIYMKLLPVRKNEKSKDIDYIMIYDTEGLRATEHINNCHHDNELSTMVIGMADIVIVNIMGETMADMTNVLQIVVYALVRIRIAYRNMNIYPTCLFVHQNTVGGEALKREMQKISEALDRVANLVADQEHIKGVTHFKDVIKFDPDVNVMHVSNLWLGKPPMAPVSNSYSKDIALVKSRILHFLSEDDLCTLSICDMYEKIQNTWNAVQSEDFIFSFRNSLEVKAYIALEKKFRSIIYDLETIHFDFIMKIGPALCRSTAEQMNAKVAHMLQKYTDKMRIEKNTAYDSLSEYINSSGLKKIMENWKMAKKRALDEEVSSLCNKFTNKVQNDAHIYKVKISHSDSEIEKRALLAVSNLAEGLKASDNSDEKNMDEFNKMWTNFLNDVAPKTPQKNIELKNNTLLMEIKRELLVLFNQHSSLLTKERKICDVEQGTNVSKLTSGLKNGILNIDATFWKETANLLSKGATKLGFFSKITPPQSILLNLLEKVTEKIDSKMYELSLQDIEYDIDVYRNLMSIVTKSIEENNQNKKRQIDITHNGQIKFALFVTRFLYREFCRLNESFDSKHSLHTWLSLKKEKARKYFICMLKEREEAEKVAIIVCEDLKLLITDRLEKIIPIQIASIVKKKFAVHKYQFLCDYLTTLAKLGNFDEYKIFLKDPAIGARQWLNRTLIDHLFNETEGKPSRFQDIVEKNINDEKESAESIASDIYSKSFRGWIEIFCRKMDKLEFDHGYEERLSRDVEKVEVETFKEIFLKLLKKLEFDFKFRKAEEKQLLVKEIVTRVFRDFWGCEEQCPWCGEPCQYERDHVSCDMPHRCIQHRPQALKGYRWVENDKLVFETCNWLVNSRCTIKCSTWCSCSTTNNSVYHPYKEYKKYIPTWDIPPSNDMSTSPYWCWFVVQYHDDLQKFYHAKAADIPESWQSTRKEKAIESISEYVQKLTENGQ